MSKATPRQDERDFYKEIARRAKRVRERAAESLRRTRDARRRQASSTEAGGPQPRRPRLRRQD